MNSFCLSVATTVLFATTAFSAPYCDALMHENQLADRYKRLAPIYSNTDNGWIFTSDQLDPDFMMSTEAEGLMRAVIGEFERRNISLAIMVAPPRAVISGQEIVNETLGASDIYNVNAASETFEKLLEQMRSVGAVVPNLLQVAMAEPVTDYYFRRDTHWTNTGAARSALALAEALNLAPGFDISQIPNNGVFDERGSLSDIVDATCGHRGDAEATYQFDYSVVREENSPGLLDEASDVPGAMLFGTSFSDRYKRDQYQVVDAISSALGRDVINASVSGGGLIGPLEAFALSGGFSNNAPELVIWEFPYTEVPQASALRQLLGVLRASDSEIITSQFHTITDGAASFQLPLETREAELLHVRLNTLSVRWIKVDLTFPNGRMKTIQLRRKSSMAAHGQFADWWVDIGVLGTARPESIRLRFDRQEDLTDGEIRLLSFAGH